MYLKELLDLKGLEFTHFFIYDYNKYLYYQQNIEVEKDFSLLKECLISHFILKDVSKLFKGSPISNFLYKRVVDIQIGVVDDIDVMEVYLCFG